MIYHLLRDSRHPWSPALRLVTLTQRLWSARQSASTAGWPQPAAPVQPFTVAYGILRNGYSRVLRRVLLAVALGSVMGLATLLLAGSAGLFTQIG